MGHGCRRTARVGRSLRHRAVARGPWSASRVRSRAAARGSHCRGGGSVTRDPCNLDVLTPGGVGRSATSPRNCGLEDACSRWCSRREVMWPRCSAPPAPSTTHAPSSGHRSPTENSGDRRYDRADLLASAGSRWSRKSRSWWPLTVASTSRSWTRTVITSSSASARRSRTL